jgi:hypothetical protein
MSKECRKRFIFLNFVKLVQGLLKTFLFLQNLEHEITRASFCKETSTSAYSWVKKIELLAGYGNAAFCFVKAMQGFSFFWCRCVD